MPKKLERKLKKKAKEKGLFDTLMDTYVYGAMRKLGWKPEKEKKAKPEKKKKTFKKPQRKAVKSVASHGLGGALSKAMSSKKKKK